MADVRADAGALDRTLGTIFDLPISSTSLVTLDNLHAHIGRRLASCLPDDFLSPTESRQKTSTTTTTTTSSGDGSTFVPADREEFVVEGASVSESEDPMIEILTADQDAERGRIGPPVVSMTAVVERGNEVRENGTELYAKSSFSTFRGNVCVFRGRWMYEVTLGTQGVQQLGWAALACQFTQQEGVGDAPNSYAYDGNRIKKWNCSPLEYGLAWVIGDVIGCCLDMDRGEVSFYRNGTPMGVAFTGVSARSSVVGGDALAYFPGVSLSLRETVSINFGARPLRFPVPGFLPLQSPPPPLLRSRARYLIDCQKRLMRYAASGDILTSVKRSTGPDMPFAAGDLLILSYRIYQHLAPWLGNEYIMASLFAPALHSLFDLQREEGLHSALALMHAALERRELDDCMRALFRWLADRCRTTSFTVSTPTGPHQYHSLALAVLRHRPTRCMWLQSDYFAPAMEAFMALKSPSLDDLNGMIPVVWWQGCLERGCNQEKFNKSCTDLDVSTFKVEEVQQRICWLLLSDATPVADEGSLSPRIYFRLWLRNIIDRNRNAIRNVPPPHLSDRSVLVSLFYIILRMLNPLLDRAGGGAIPLPVEMFYNGQVNYFDFNRMGGAATYVLKEHPIEGARPPAPIPTDAVLEEMGPYDAFTRGDLAADMRIDSATLTVGDVSFRAGTPSASGEEQALPVALVHELVDVTVFLYHLAMTPQFKVALALLQRRRQAAQDVDEMSIRMITASGPTLINLDGQRQKHLAELFDCVRHSSWHRIRLYTHNKQMGIHALHTFLCSFLTRAANQSDPDAARVFPYVPEFYLETMVDSFHDLRRADPPFSFASCSTELRLFIEFLLLHFADARIVNPDLRDLLLQSISLVLQYRQFVNEFEANELARATLIHTLLESYHSRFWVTVTNTNILLRFWRGRGFGQGGQASDTNSTIFQQRFKETCLAEQPLYSTFLNCVFNSLNWTMTEFSTSLNEIQEALTNAGMDMQPMTRKCNVMFELAVNLLRLLECIALELPHTFLTRDSVHGTRLAEALVYAMNRYTTGHDAHLFNHLLDLNMIALEKIQRKLVLGPVIGIILALWQARHEPTHAIALTELLATEPAFVPTSFEYLTGFCADAFPEDPGAPAQADALRDCAAQLAFDAAAKQKRDLAEERLLTESPSYEVCTICYANPINTTFKPCGHRSCYKCISRHILNSKRCFFCNAEVSEFVRDAGTIDDDASSAPSTPAAADGSGGAA